MVAIHPRTIDLIEGSAKLKERYLEQAKKVSKSFLLTGLSLINDCDVNYPLAQHKRLHVEICLSRITYMSRARRVSSEEVGPKKKEVTKTSREQKAAAEAPKPEPAPEVQPQVPDAPSIKETPAQAAKKSGGIPTIIPKIASTKEIQKEAQIAISHQPKQGDELSLSSLHEAWNKYVMRLTSASVKKLYETSAILLEEDTVIVKVATQIAKDSLSQDDSFIQGLREKFHRSDLKVDIQIDEEKAAALKKETVKPLNAREKFQKMVEKNPLLQKMRDDFDLIPDGEL
jgi:DNA polymerase-3 subunit gamma/tau